MDKRLNKALAMQESGEFGKAVTVFKQILKANSSDIVALYSLGVLSHKLGKHESALEYFEKASKVKPDFAQTWFSRGVVLQALHRYEEALSSYNRALEIDPGYSQAKINKDGLSALIASKEDKFPVAIVQVIQDMRLRALQLQGEEKLDEAIELFENVLQMLPSEFVSLYSLSALYMKKGNLSQALEYADKTLDSNPDYAPAWYNRGTILMSLKRGVDALGSFDHALSIDPSHIETMVNRGAMLVEMKRHKDALLNYEELLKLDPGNIKALCNRGIILTDFKMYDLAINTFEHLLLESPEFDFALGLLAFAKMHACDWKGLAELQERIIEGVRAGKRVCKTQALLAITGDPSDHLKCARIFSKQHYPPQEPIWRGEKYNHDKIRIAYISPDFREHPVGHLTAGIFEHHDKGRFETIAISLGIDDNSRLRERMVEAFDRFVDVRQMSSHDVAIMMREMEIDIAVDLGGYTADTRTDILAWRPAPIHVNFLGYSSTMGVDYIDYIIADRHIIPEEFRDCYSEKVVCLPDTYLPTDSSVQIAETTPLREEYGLPAHGFVFCSFNHDYKITPEIFDVWMRLLAKVPGSVFWLMKLNESAEGNLRREAVSRGINPERIIFASRVPRIEDHLARYRLADLFLDTTPYNAHTTTSDVLRAGLPVLTCRGSSFASRVAAGLLTLVGLPELITDTIDEYEALALKLAQGTDMLREIRNKLQRNLETTPLYDTARYSCNLERAFQIMWERYQKGDQPQHFAVDVTEEIGKAPTNARAIAILVPIYKEILDDSEQFSLDFLVKNAPMRDKIFVAPRSLNQSYYRERYGIFKFELFEDHYFTSVKSYNHLLLNDEFYERFSVYEYILIHQTDALIFHDNLDYWQGRGFDYVGAPWPSGVEVKMQLGRFALGDGLNLKAYVGNGGFSLRSVKGSRAVLQEFEDIRNHWITSNSSEDLFFAFMGMVSDCFKIPNQIIASQFSLELEPEKYYTINSNKIPTGCHAGWKVYESFWKPIIKFVSNAQE